MTVPTTHFSTLQRLLHWLMAIGILAMLFIGVGMVSTIGRQYVPLLITHKTLGIAILVLALVRLVVRFISGAPPLPADLPEPMKLASHPYSAGHSATGVSIKGSIPCGSQYASAIPAFWYSGTVSR